MAYFYKLWPWVEANKNRLIGVGVIVVIAGFFIAFYFWQQNQKELAAGQALTEVLVSTSPNADASQLAGSYSKVAADSPAHALANARQHKARRCCSRPANTLKHWRNSNNF